MIGSFKHIGLREIYEKGKSRKVAVSLHERILRRLDFMRAAKKPEDLNVPGFNFHRLRGKPIRYSIHINGPWCITFGWEDDAAININLEQYH